MIINVLWIKKHKKIQKKNINFYWVCFFLSPSSSTQNNIKQVSQIYQFQETQECVCLEKHETLESS